MQILADILQVGNARLAYVGAKNVRFVPEPHLAPVSAAEQRHDTLAQVVAIRHANNKDAVGSECLLEHVKQALG